MPRLFGLKICVTLLIVSLAGPQVAMVRGQTPAQQEAERRRQEALERQREQQAERQRQMEAERERQAEAQRQAQEHQRQVEAERERQQAQQAERERQAEAQRQAQERQRQVEAERERQQAQAERERQAEAQRQAREREQQRLDAERAREQQMAREAVERKGQLQTPIAPRTVPAAVAPAPPNSTSNTVHPAGGKQTTPQPNNFTTSSAGKGATTPTSPVNTQSPVPAMAIIETRTASRQAIVDAVFDGVRAVVTQINPELGEALNQQGPHRDLIQESVTEALTLLSALQHRGRGDQSAAADTQVQLSATDISTPAPVITGFVASEQTSAAPPAVSSVPSQASPPDVSTQPDNSSRLPNICAAWENRNFKVTAWGNDDLTNGSNAWANIVDSKGDPAFRGNFINVLNQNPTYHFYFGLGSNGVLSNDLAAGSARLLPLGTHHSESDVNVTEQWIHVKYCKDI